MGGLKPDHNTINNFRSQRLEEDIKTIFKKAVRTAYDTIIESVANRYSFVWSKNIARFKGNLEEKIKGLLSEIEEVLQEEKPSGETEETKPSGSEEQEPEDESSSSKPLTSEDLSEKVSALEEIEDKKVKKLVKQLKKKHLPKLAEYEQHQEKLNGRSSYSKTDPDATFMRLKEDHMKNGQLKPAYNWMISSEEQFIINYTLHQNPNDAVCYQSHTNDTLDLLTEEGLPTFKRSMGDSIFGTEENYEYLEKKGIDSFLKYPTFHSEKTKKVQNNPFLGKNFFYNDDLDFMVCPMGQRMNPVSETSYKKKSGYRANISIYQAKNCKGCPLRSKCQPSKKESPKGNRTVTRNHNLEKHKQQARENLNSLMGIRLRSKRRVDVEPPFGNIKYNNRFDRLTLRSLPKVNIEIGLLCLAHNLKKIWKFIWKDRIGTPNPIKNQPNTQIIGENQSVFSFSAFLQTTFVVMTHRTNLTFNP